MIGFIILLALAAVFVGGVAGAIWGASQHDDGFAGGMTAMAAGIVLLFIVPFIWIVPISRNISAASNIDRIDRDVVTVAEREVELEAVIREGLEPYPEFEAGVIETIDPDFLLSFPDLRASETMTRAVEEIVAVRDRKFLLELERSQLLAGIAARERNPFLLTWGDGV